MRIFSFIKEFWKPSLAPDQPIEVQATECAQFKLELQQLDGEINEVILELHHRSIRRLSKRHTIHDAWNFHPQAKDVFASVYLDNCDKCAVRFDETIE